MIGVGDLSAHFSSHEFVDARTGHRMGPPAELVLVLEKLRALSGQPLRIVSGHRCCATNSTIGGASQSRHIAGDAADIAPGRFTLRQARAAGATGVGVRDGWVVHVDVRPGPFQSWEY